MADIIDIADRFGPGGNAPPEASPLRLRLEEEHAGTLAEAQRLANEFDRIPLVVTSDEEEGVVAALAKDIRRTRKNVEATRVAEKEPFLSSEREVDGLFAPVVVLLDRYSKLLTERTTVYLTAKADAERRVREEEERRRQQEAARAAEEARQRVLALARAEEERQAAARQRRDEEERAERERLRLIREEEDRVERERLRLIREEEERVANASREISRQKQSAIDKKNREAREMAEREATAARQRQFEENRRAREARETADEANRIAAEAQRLALAEAQAAQDAARQAEERRIDAERASQEAPADMARTRTASGLSTLVRGWDFEVEDWARVETALGALGPYIPRKDVEAALRRLLKTHGDSKPVAGVRIFATREGRHL
jgi:hypothetical protein